MLESFVNNKLIQKKNMLIQSNLYPFFRAIGDTVGSKVYIKNQKQIMIGSNNYLGLTHHPYVKEKAIKAIEQFGTGCTGSRFLNGNLEMHEELEEKLAKFIGHKAALIFSTGMQANLGAISCIAGPRDCIISDLENHASIIDGTRLAYGTVFKYKHSNMNCLEEVLQNVQEKYQRKIIITDGVFSMTGTIANLTKIVELAKKYGALVYVDDAHGLGVLGHQGKGTINHFAVTSDVHINMGTFSKSFASIGGFISGSKEVVDFIKHSARSFIFSASMPPAAVATVAACIDVVTTDPSVLSNLWSNVNFMRHGYKEIGLYTYNSETPIIPIYVGDDLKALQVSSYLTGKGIFSTPVIAPAVKEGEALIRTSYMATHEKEDLAKVLEVFSDAKRLFELPSIFN
ncbi:MAG: 8-amino-7-oxononanoate synthase [Bdellovibrionales bacterium RIFOXYB1_FULL_37_110]|nr:MAG: 8-amino-7-oxononanoate synthase [Bdellovibrionales bacterium RIFOXYA1_FULL_38_20]OFZ48015.1 MAG: 8-amino-7-oxononanoate synthase [Bdellovibrionales bacterium RIFOXYC1_FULL_37_79]OFZ58032.1 MAG: 8-amino-7-oxononanoate synthase [Bdellovibrionales bacterium RIFOXYB1_FULL_37_110]OFZ61674.1 MAG: 8-amino-7-oxononanoate synthase [Bdellovibrionales bacterium RIFOXYD1_FULL_36_51]